MSIQGYRDALEAAGATVHEFEEFGSYQGDWWAKVTYQGKSGWVNGSYGSCSGCDAYEAEIGYSNDSCDKHRWGSTKDVQDVCADCQNAKLDQDAKLSSFGKQYLEDGMILSQEEAEKEAARNLSWDSDASAMVKFVKDNA